MFRSLITVTLAFSKNASHLTFSCFLCNHALLLIDIITPVPVAVTEVECVCEGYQSEALRRLSGTLPENQCFTVVFKGARKSLDLKCPTAEEAQHWVRGLRTLKERVASMSQKEKLDQYPAQFPIC